MPAPGHKSDDCFPLIPIVDSNGHFSSFIMQGNGMDCPFLIDSFVITFICSCFYFADTGLCKGTVYDFHHADIAYSTFCGGF